MKKKADIIDLEFYRKFRIVLPVRSQKFYRGKRYEDSAQAMRTYRRRRRPQESESIVNTEE